MFSPPFTYDDPRLTYDEHCFYYDGGYDEVCLVIGFGRKRSGGRSNPPSRQTIQPFVTASSNAFWINVEVRSRVFKINQELFKEEEEVVQSARGELDPGEIELIASRVDSTPSTFAVLAESVDVKTDLDPDERNIASVIVMADPITAKQAGRTIPLANLKTKTTKIIFKTEHLSGSKPSGKKT